MKNKTENRYLLMIFIIYVYLINIIPTHYLNNNSPKEILYGKSCNLNNLRVFFCLSYISTLVIYRKKLDSRDLGISLKFEANKKIYFIYNLKTNNFDISCNVIFFYKNQFSKTKFFDNEHMFQPYLLANF